jgi:hypothetical protein
MQAGHIVDFVFVDAKSVTLENSVKTMSDNSVSCDQDSALPTAHDTVFDQKTNNSYIAHTHHKTVEFGVYIQQ